MVPFYLGIIFIAIGQSSDESEEIDRIVARQQSSLGLMWAVELVLHGI